MIRSTFVKILCVFVVMLLVGIISFIILLPKQEKHSDKQVGTIPQANLQKDMPKIQVSPQKDTTNLQDKTDKIDMMFPEPGVSDEELKAFLTKFENTEITEDMLDTSDPDFIELTKMYELIAAGKHPDYPPPPSREDFSSKLDYLKADLEYYKKKVLEAEGTKYQVVFESDVASIEDQIELEKKLIKHEERWREWKEEIEPELIDRNVSFALLMSQSSDEDWNYYLEHLFPSIPPHLQDTVVERFLSVPQASDVSEPVSDTPIPSAESRERNSVPTPQVTPTLTGQSPLPDQISRWHEELVKDFPDIFAYPDAKSREAFSQKLPTEGSRQYFRERQSALHKEYAALLQPQLKDVPKEKREQAIATFRHSLLEKWDREFVDAIINEVRQGKTKAENR